MSIDDIRQAAYDGVRHEGAFQLAEEGFELADAIWNQTHPDYRSETIYDPHVLMLRDSGTCAVRLHALPISKLREMKKEAK